MNDKIKEIIDEIEDMNDVFLAYGGGDEYQKKLKELRKKF